MHMMVFDPNLNMMRGITFFEPDVPKYSSREECTARGMKIISEAKKEFIDNYKKSM